MQGPKGVLVVDQHIAHERVLYERFREAAENKKVEVQDLLFPLAVEFPPAEAQALLEHLESLKEAFPQQLDVTRNSRGSQVELVAA